MRSMVSLAAGLGVAVAAFGQQPAERAADESAIRAVVQEFIDARDRNDARGLEAILTEDADQQVTSGDMRSGRDDVIRGSLGTNQRTGGVRTITVESIRFIAPDVALVDGRYDVSGLVGGTTRNMLTSMVVKREASAWRIAAIRNMLPAESEAPSR